MGIGGMIAGALAGGGEALQKVGGSMLLDAAQKERDERLAEIERQKQERGFAHAERLTDKQISATREEGAAGRTLQRELQSNAIASSEKMGQAQMALQVMLADMREKGDDRRAGMQAGIAYKQMEQAWKIAKMNQVPLVNEKGELYVKNESGQPEYLYDPSAPEGGRMKSQKQLTDTEKAMFQAHAHAISVQLVETAKDQTMDPKTKAEAIQTLMNSLYAGPKKPGEASAAAPYPEGTELTGRDGKLYVVKDGKPVLKDQKARPATSGSLSSMFPGPEVNPDAPVPKAWNALKAAKKEVDEETPEGHVAGLVDYARRALR